MGTVASRPFTVIVACARKTKGIKERFERSIARGACGLGVMIYCRLFSQRFLIYFATLYSRGAALFRVANLSCCDFSIILTEMKEYAALREEQRGPRDILKAAA